MSEEGVTFEDWLAVQPSEIQKLAGEFPLLTNIRIEDSMHWVLGWGEGDKLAVSPLDPRVSGPEKATRVAIELPAQLVRGSRQTPH